MKTAVLLLFLALTPTVKAQSGGGQTAQSVSAFTTDTLKAYLDALAVKDAQILALHKELSELRDKHAQELRDAADKRYDQRFQAQEAASTYTRGIQNEFRGSLTDLASTKLSKSEFETAHKALQDQITTYDKSVSEKLLAFDKANASAVADIQHRLDIKEGSATGVGNFIFLAIAVTTVIVLVLGYILSTRRNRSVRA